LGVTLIFVLLYCLFQGKWEGGTLSDGFFLASFILFAIAAQPIAGEVVRSFTMSSRMAKEQQDYKKVMAAEQKKRTQGALTTYLFGIAGIITLVLTLLALRF